MVSARSGNCSRWSGSSCRTCPRSWPCFAGLITAVVAGLVATVFGGSNVQVSGPTGAMTVVLVPIVARYGADAVFTVGLIAGALVVAAALLRAGRYLAYVPWPVMEGFTV